MGHSPRRIRLLVGTVIACIEISCLSACAPKVEDTGAAPAVDEPTPEEKARQKEMEKEARLASQLQQAKDFRSKNRGSHGEAMAFFKKLTKSHAGTKFEKEVQACIDEVQKDFEDTAMKSLQKVRVEAEAQIATGDFATAEDLLMRWNQRDEFAGSKAVSERDKFLDEIVLRYKASQEFDQRKLRGTQLKNQGDYAKAIAVFEGYSDRFKFDETRFKEVRSLIDECYVKYKEEKAADKVIDDIPWEDQPVHEGLAGFRKSVVGDFEVWTSSGGEIEGSNVTKDWTLLGAGEDNWEEYRVEFEVKLAEEGQELVLGAHNFVRAGTAIYDIHRVPDLESGKWHKLWMIVERGHVIVYSHDSGENIYDGRQRNFYGGFAFLLQKEGQQIAIRNIRFRVTKKVADDVLKGTPAAPADGDGDKGKKKKPVKEP